MIILSFVSLLLFCCNESKNGMNYKDSLGRKQGKWVLVLSSLRQEGEYRNGIKVGVWKEFFHNNLSREISYDTAIVTLKDTFYIMTVTHIYNNVRTTQDHISINKATNSIILDSAMFLFVGGYDTVGVTKEVIKGGVIYNKTCTECHAKETEFLAPILNKENVSDKDYFISFVQDSDRFIKTGKMKNYLEYHKYYKHSYNISKPDLTEIYFYIKTINKQATVSASKSEN